MVESLLILFELQCGLYYRKGCDKFLMKSFLFNGSLSSTNICYRRTMIVVLVYIAHCVIET